MTHEIDLEAMLEALIFVSKEPLSHERLGEILAASNIEMNMGDIKRAMKALMAKWSIKEREHGRGMVLQEIAHGYAFLSAPEHALVVKKIALEKPIEITKAQVEVLSIVAYRQPITRVDIDEIRGVDSSFAIKRLMQLKLLKILGKSEGLGRPLLYGTTKRFLEFFSLNSLNDLPTLKQIEALTQGELVENIELPDEQVSIKDLFKEYKNSSMFSKDVVRLSDEALKTLDDALLRVNSHVEKTSTNDELI
jgi:segregation and condensation protein B